MHPPVSRNDRAVADGVSDAQREAHPATVIRFVASTEEMRSPVSRGGQHGRQRDIC